MWKREAYLVWIEERLSTAQTEGEGEEVNDSDSNHDDSDSDHGEPIASATTVNDATPLPSVAQYTVAKKAPFHQLTVEKIISQFGAIDFIEALHAFLRRHIPACKISPNIFDRFDVYKQITIPLPFNRYLSNHSRVDRIRSTPAVAKSGRKAGTAARFDTALLVENWEDYRKFGGLKGVLYFFWTSTYLTH